jgi:membrane protein required for colicin V production
MSRINISDFLNLFDIVFIIICLISIFFAIKSGLIKSFFNLVKWITIIYIIKNIFSYLRPIFDQYIPNQTIADISIFFLTLIVSYILLSSLNRVIVGIIQPKRSGFVDFSLGALFGLLRGYIIIVLLFSFINSSIDSGHWPNYLSNGSFFSIVEYGDEFINTIPKRIGQLKELGV